MLVMPSARLASSRASASASRMAHTERTALPETSVLLGVLASLQGNQVSGVCLLPYILNLIAIRGGHARKISVWTATIKYWPLHGIPRTPVALQDAHPTR